MSDWPILSVVTFLPLVGAALILSIRGEDETALRNIRWAALWTTIVTFCSVAAHLARLRPGEPGHAVRRAP